MGPVKPAVEESDLDALVDEATKKKILESQPKKTLGDYPIRPDNWETIQVFLGCSTQWEYNDFNGRRRGLNYPGLESVIRNYQIEEPEICFCEVQTMEFAAVQALNEALK